MKTTTYAITMTVIAISAVTACGFMGYHIKTQSDAVHALLQQCSDQNNVALKNCRIKAVDVSGKVVATEPQQVSQAGRVSANPAANGMVILDPPVL